MPVSASDIAVAILPFQNLSDDPRWDCFALGFTQDLIADLSRFSALQIISPMASRKSNPGPIHNLTSLGAHYVVEGSFRCQENQFRINTQLIQSDSGALVWADRFDEDVRAIFQIQDQLSEKIVSAIQHQIDVNLLSGAKRKNTGHLAAYELWLRGMEHLKKGTLENDLQARELFHSALAIDPSYARAYTGLSLSYFNEWSCQLWDRWEVSQKGAFEYAHKAVLCDDTDCVSLAVLGRIYLYQGQYDKAEYYTRRSIQANSNDADNLIMLATNLVFLGFPQEAEVLYLKALRINPLHPQSYYGCGVFIYFEMGEDQKCISLAERTPKEAMWVDMPAFIAAAYFHLGDHASMAAYWDLFLQQYQAKILVGKEVDIQEAVRWVLHANPFRQDSRLKPFLESIAQAEVSWSYPKSNMAAAIPVFNTFKKQNELWEFAFDGKTVYLPEVKGFLDLMRLMASQGEQVHCTELMGSVVEQDDHYFVLDEKAKRDYQKRILSLKREMQEAEDENDMQMLGSLRQEYETLVDSLSHSLGLAGKSRKIGSSLEKTRSAVTWRIRSAIQKIERAHPSLGRHLSKAIETGIFCSYSPERQEDWLL